MAGGGGGDAGSTTLVTALSQTAPEPLQLNRGLWRPLCTDITVGLFYGISYLTGRCSMVEVI